MLLPWPPLSLQKDLNSIYLHHPLPPILYVLHLYSYPSLNCIIWKVGFESLISTSQCPALLWTRMSAPEVLLI